MKNRIKLVQQILKEKGFYSGAIDGFAGPKTAAGLSKVREVNNRLPLTRQVTMFIQLSANERNIDAGPVDGFWGPRTNTAYETLVYYMEHGELPPRWRPEERQINNPNNWPVQNSTEFNDFYGPRSSQLVS